MARQQIALTAIKECSNAVHYDLTYSKRGKYIVIIAAK